MMTLKIKLIIIAAVLVFLAFVVNMVKKRSLELKYALAWLILGVALIIIVLVPGLLEWGASVLGIYSVVNMVFFIGLCILMIIIFTMTIALSRNSSRIRKLAQEVALNNKRWYENDHKKEEKNS